MGDKNQIATAISGTDLQVKAGHGILKAIYTAVTGDEVWVVRDGTGAVASTGCITFATAVAGDTITLNGLLYTGVAGARCGCAEFSIDTSDAATATDFAVAVNCDCRLPDCATITTHDITAGACAAVVCVTADVIGQTGNFICLTTTAMCMTIVVAPTTGFLGCGDGDEILTIDLVGATSGQITMPFLNHPFADGLFLDSGCGAAGNLTLVFE